MSIEEAFVLGETELRVGHVIVRLTALGEGDALRAVRISCGAWRSSEQDFLDQRYDASSRALLPVVEFADVSSGSNDACVVFGVHKWLFFGNASVPELIVPNRGKSDDRGFYKTEVFNDSFGAVIVYEGGVIGVCDGSPVWHVPKNWEDAVAGVGKFVEVLRESGEVVRLSRETGRVTSSS